MCVCVCVWWRYGIKTGEWLMIITAGGVRALGAGGGPDKAMLYGKPG